MIMKTTITTLFLCAVALEAIAQATMPRSLEQSLEIDATRYIVTYNVDFVADTLKMQKEDDIHLLEIGNTCVKSYSKNLFDTDSVGDAWAKKGREVAPRYQKATIPTAI